MGLGQDREDEMQWHKGLVIGGPQDADEFEIVRELAGGSAVMVWLARKRRGERAGTQCVLKQINTQGLADEELRKRRSRQASAAKIGTMLASQADEAGYDNVMKIYGRGDWQGSPYLEIEYIDGESLQHRLATQKGGLSPEQILIFALQLCDAVHLLHAHPAVIVHNDITTSNLIVTRRTLITGNQPPDLAATSARGNQTLSGERLVLIDFESSVCSDDLPVSRTNDIRLVAVVIGDMLTGKNTLHALRAKHPLEEILPKNDRLSRAVRRALDQDPKKWPRSIDDFRTDLTAPQGAGIRDRFISALMRQPSSSPPPNDDDMILIPAGDFPYGMERHEPQGHSGQGDALNGQDARAKSVFVKEFYIDRTPVTNRQYLEFVNNTGRRDVPYHDTPLAAPYNWDRKARRPPPGMEEYPVVLVNWSDAIAYAEWCSKRLPTEKEWEKAARGVEGWLYPWGNEWDRTRCNNLEQWLGRDILDAQGWRYFMKAVIFDLEKWSQAPGKGMAPVLATPVTHYLQTPSPFGVLDMSGNVWEWTADILVENEDYHVLRGGSWLEGREGVRVTARIGEWPKARLPWIGFRCARNSRPER